MGGPVAAVLIERPLDDEAFGTLMRSLGANAVVGGEASFDVEIECGGIDCERYFPGGIWSWGSRRRVAAVVAQFVGQSSEDRWLLADLAVGLDVEEQEMLLEIVDELDANEKHVGGLYLQEIVVMARSNSDASHLALARTSALIAEAIPGAMIDMGGMPMTTTYRAWTEERETVLKRLRRNDGFCVDVPYGTDYGTFASLVVDARFIRSWMTDPLFRMIK